ncbi:type IV conjugative transfer system protein TraV [Escherichia coli]|nr:type IV conjugative transfer system protein TraV [Escherichia coli]
MKQISLFIPLLGTLLLSGCAGTITEFECNATTSDTCMTMEQANEKAKSWSSLQMQSRLRHHCRAAEGNFRTTTVRAVTAASPSGSGPVVTALPGRNCWHHVRCLRLPGSENDYSGQFSCVGNTSRPLRTGEQTAALWIAPYIDNQDVYHQPSSVFFVIKPSAWGKPRIN